MPDPTPFDREAAINEIVRRCGGSRDKAFGATVRASIMTSSDKELRETLADTQEAQAMADEWMAERKPAAEPASEPRVTARGVVQLTQLVRVLTNAQDRDLLPAGHDGRYSKRDYDLTATYTPKHPTDWRDPESRESEAETALLDEFHATVPIACLEDFRWEVLSPSQAADFCIYDEVQELWVEMVFGAGGRFTRSKSHATRCTEGQAIYAINNSPGLAAHRHNLIVVPFNEGARRSEAAEPPAKKPVAKYSSPYAIDCANIIMELKTFGASAVAFGLADLIDQTWDEDDEERKAGKQKAIDKVLALARWLEREGS